MLVRIHRVESGKYHRLQLFETGQRLERGAIILGNGIADLGVGNVLDVGN